MRDEINTIIIEDEAPAQNELLQLIKEFNQGNHDNINLNIVTIASDGPAAFEKIVQHKPELIFLDIELPGYNGFSVVEKISKVLDKEQLPKIIFTTAYDQYALKAFEVCALDYLLKPIEMDKLIRAIGRISSLKKNPEENSLEKELDELRKLMIFYKNKDMQNTFLSGKLALKLGDEVKFLGFEEIIFIKADNKYSIISTFKEDFLASYSLKELSEILPLNFERNGRSSILNLQKINGLKKWFAGKYKAVMQDEKQTEITLHKDLKNKLFHNF